MCKYTNNHFSNFREYSLNFSFRKFLLWCMGWFSLKLWEVLLSTKSDLLATKIWKNVMFTKIWDTRFYHLSNDIYIKKKKKKKKKNPERQWCRSSCYIQRITLSDSIYPMYAHVCYMYTSMTFDRSNALRSGHGFFPPNLVAIGQC